MTTRAESHRESLREKKENSPHRRTESDVSIGLDGTRKKIFDFKNTFRKCLNRAAVRRLSCQRPMRRKLLSVLMANTDSGKWYEVL
jgi:hypothetical protein